MEKTVIGEISIPLEYDFVDSSLPPHLPNPPLDITIDVLAPHVCILDETSRILAVNHAWKTFADANPPAPPHYGVGMNYLDICEQATGSSSQGAASFAAGLRTVLAGESTEFAQEYPCHTPEGVQRWFNARVARYANGEGFRVLISHENITPYKQIEIQLQESEAVYRHLFNHHPFPTWIYDLETLAFLEVNEAAIARYGYSRADFLQMTLKDIRPAAEIPLLMENLAQPRQPTESSEGWRHQLKDGRVIEVSITSHALTFNGRPAVLVTAQDITIHKQQLALQSAALEASANAIVIATRQGVIEWANPAFTALTGYHFPDEVLGKNPRDLLKSNQHTPAFYKRMWETILAGQTWHGELINRRKDGSLYDEEMTITPVRDSAGEISHFIAIKQDITARKRAEDASRQSHARLAAVVAVEHTLAAALTPEDIFTRLAEGIPQFFTDVATLFISHFNAETQMIQAMKGLHEGEWIDVSTLPQLPLAPDGKGTQSQVIRSRQPLIIETGLESKFHSTNTVRIGDTTRDTQSALYVPMLAQHQVVGLIHLQSYTPHRFTEEDAQLLSLVANTAAVSLQNARLYEAAQKEIEERKQAEENLRISEERYRHLIENMSDVILEIDAQGNFCYVSPNYEAMSGYRTEDELGTAALTHVHPEDVPTLLQHIEKIWQGEPQRMNYRVHTKPAGYRWLETSGRLVEAPDGSLRVLGVARDVTEQKKAEEALRASEALFSKIFYNSPVGINIFSLRDGRSYQVNDTFLETIGYTRQEMIGRTATELDLFPNQAARDAWMNTLRAGGQVRNQDTKIRHKSGGLRDGLASLDVLDINGEPMVLVMATDITDRKTAEYHLERQFQRISALHEIDRAISSSLDLQLTLDILLSEVRSQLNVDAASVLLLNAYIPLLEYRAGKGFLTSHIRETRVYLGDGLAGKVGLERRTLFVPSVPQTEIPIIRTDLFAKEGVVAYVGVPLIAKGTLKGMLEIFHRTPLNPDPEWMNYLETISGQAAIAIDNAQLFEGVQRSNLELITAYDATIVGWSHAMDLRDKETEGHTQRVTELTLKLARQMNLPPQDLLHIRRGALLHDIGKLGVPDQILLKPGKLTDEEWVIMRQHPIYALEMLSPIAYLRPSLDIPYCHHEKWDGTGYPRGLKGEQIPLSARLFAIIDVWDALRSDRPYRASWPAEKTRNYIIEQTGLHFDPQVVEAFLTLLESDPDLSEGVT